MSSFRTIRKFLGPSWLVAEGEGAIVGYALDLVKDAFIERVRIGLLARFPQQDPSGTPAPDDALQAMGRDRDMIRGLDESATNYAARLVPWLDQAKTKGTPWGMLTGLWNYLGLSTGFPIVLRTVDAKGNWFTRAADGTFSYLLKQGNWEWDSTPIDPVSGKKRWSRFWPIVYPNGLWLDTREWNDGASWGDDDKTWGTTATPDEAAQLYALALRKPGGTNCPYVIVAFDPDSFDPTAAVDADGMPNFGWGRDASYVDDVQVSPRLETARYVKVP